MKKNIKNVVMHQSLRIGAFLFLLSSSHVVFAQDDNEDTDEVETPAIKKVNKVNLPTYEMTKISGQIVDGATNKPLAGVRVQALNNYLYTAMTDEKGMYTISVPTFVTALYVSTPEYNPIQIAVKGATGQNGVIYNEGLGAIYIDGTKLTKSESIKLNNSSALSVDDEIENRLNGTMRTNKRGGLPAQGSLMLIDGLNSLNSTIQPLVIVDGVEWDMQYDRSTLHDGFVTNLLNVLDPEDIEDVQVLRNGTALYGAKAANGVIIINTRRGKSLATRINVRAYGGFESTPSLLDVMNGEQYRSYATGFIGTTKYGQDNSSTTTTPWLNEDPNYTFYNKYHNNTDWQKDLYRTGFNQNYKVNVEGGDDIAKYRLSLGLTQADATAESNDFQRLNIRFNTDIFLSSKLSTVFDIAYSRVSYNLRDNGWGEDYSTRNISSPNVLGLIQSPMLSNYEYYVVWNEATQKNELVSSNMYAAKDGDDSDSPFLFGRNYGTDALANPYWILQNGKGDNKNYYENTYFQINAQPKYEVTSDLLLTDRFSYMSNRSTEKYFLPLNGTPSKDVEGLGSVNSAIKSQYGTETTLFNDLRIDFTKQLGKHYVKAFGGFRLASYSYSDNYVSGYNNQSDKMPNLSYSGLQYKTYGGSKDTWINLAYYLNGDYNYMNRYFGQATLTMETSSRFGKNTSDGIKLFGVKWGLFPSLQAGWLISSEPWFKSKAVDYLKLTAGYQETGNDNIDYYASRTYYANVKFIDMMTALQLSNISNSSIQWEVNKRFDLGLDGNFFNNRLSLGFDVFWSKTSNLLVKESTGPLAGVPYIWTNGGALKNTGFNVKASGLILNTRDWKVQAGFMIGHYKNEITKLPSGDSYTITAYNLDANGQNAGVYKTIHGYTSSVYGTDNVLTSVGDAAGVFYGYQTAGVFASDAEAQSAGNGTYLKYPTGLTGDNAYRYFKAGDVHFVDQNGDGWISEADMVKIGDPNPDVYGNIFALVSWKKWTLDFSFKYSLGNDVFNYQRSQLESVNNLWNQTKAVLNRWTYEGQITDIPRAMSTSSDEWVNNERFSDRWIEDGSYLKLKKVRLTYKVPVTSAWLQGLTLWGEVNNVFTITKYLGTDPEVSSGNGALYQGIDAGYLSQGRNFNLGVTINL